MAKPSLPPVLYKYCTAKVAKLNLTHRAIRFSSPLRFNDPFDCYFPPRFFNLRHAASSLERRRLAIIAGEETLPGGSKAAFDVAPLIALQSRVPKVAVERAFKSARERSRALGNLMNQSWRELWRSDLRKLRILCFCAAHTNPLLWSHYADSHRGIVLGFKSSGMPFSRAQRVGYSKRAPRVFSRSDFEDYFLKLKPLPDVRERLGKLMTQKAKEWHYEHEWRIVNVNGGNESETYSDVAFIPDSLTKVFFGCRISVPARNAIERLLSGDFRHVEVYQAVQPRATFRLKFERVR